VGYGADARAVIEVIGRHAAEGALVLKGNHDEAIDKSAGYFNDASRAALRWARDTLSAEQKRFLMALPLVAREGASGVTANAHCSVHVVRVPEGPEETGPDAS